MTTLASAVSNPSSPVAFLAWFGCILGVYVFGQGFLRLSHRRRPRNGTPSAIRDARPGVLHAGGLVEGEVRLFAVFSGKPCFYSRATVWRQDAGQVGGWEKAAEETQSSPFVLNDTTGRLLVDPSGAEVDLPRETHEEYGKTLLATHTDIPVGLEEFLARHKVDTRSALRVEEYLLSPGAEVFVYGTVIPNPEAQAATPAVKTKIDFLEESRKATHSREPMPTPQQVIRLSPEISVPAAADMTMQSRLAAALTLARSQAVEASAMATEEAKGSVAVEESVEEYKDGRDKSASLVIERTTLDGAVVDLGAVELAATNSAASTKSAAVAVPPPRFRMRRVSGDSSLTISHRLEANGPGGASMSNSRTVALLVAGPLIAVANAYFLLASFGWF